ncbi:hypothetical protein CEG14_18025 [Bordetella genomosp. 1]|uniref:Uncharacterized protein n=1 Tax=Bordetella genomosp. 1 TaxID=1395607 RepID=A0A261S7N5_9BORD|nr:hypothetical protein [Bordetella genomosp. 1]OZI32790.1 hypothetical protein CEG14_18025 [Bordetella genomosp. 1]
MGRLRDVEDFPILARVITPSGRQGVVVAHQGAHSEHDTHERCVVRYTDSKGAGADRGTVELLPRLLKTASEGRQFELF